MLLISQTFFIRISIKKSNKNSLKLDNSWVYAAELSDNYKTQILNLLIIEFVLIIWI